MYTGVAPRAAAVADDVGDAGPLAATLATQRARSVPSAARMRRSSQRTGPQWRA